MPRKKRTTRRTKRTASAGITTSFLLLLVFYMSLALVAVYGLKKTYDTRSKAVITQELTTTMYIVANQDVMNQNGVRLESPTTQESWVGRRNQPIGHLGLRFTGIVLPAESTILGATLSVTSSRNQTNSTDMSIHAEKNGNPQPFSADAPPATRTLTAGVSIALSQESWNRNDTVTYDVTNQVKELYTDTTPSNHVAIIVVGRGSAPWRKFLYNNLNAAYAPKLTIRYAINAPTPTRTPTPTPPALDLSPTACPYPPGDSRCGNATMPVYPSPTPTPTPDPIVPFQQPTPTACPYLPGDSRCG